MSKPQITKRFGLTDAELKELQRLKRLLYSNAITGVTSLPALRRRLKELDQRAIFKFYPEEDEHPDVETMIDTGFFLVNPKAQSDLPPASMYFEDRKQIAAMMAIKENRPWTLVDGDEGTEWLEQGRHSVNVIAVLFEDPDWATRMGLAAKTVVRPIDVSLDADSLVTLLK